MRMRFFGIVACCLLTGLVSPPAVAFNADGVWSGMSREQLAASALRFGLLLRNEAPDRVSIAAPGASTPGATLGFCGKVLTTYTRNISSDADYAATLARVFGMYGPPRVMSFRGDVTTDIDSGSGTLQSYVITDWVRGADRVQLKSYFDWRIQRGNLGRFQPATIVYEMRSPCTPR